MIIKANTTTTTKIAEASLYQKDIAAFTETPAPSYVVNTGSVSHLEVNDESGEVNFTGGAVWDGIQEGKFFMLQREGRPDRLCKVSYKRELGMAKFLVVGHFPFKNKE